MFFFHTESSKVCCEFYSTAPLSMDKPHFKCSLAIWWIDVHPMMNTTVLTDVKTNTTQPSLEVEFPQAASEFLLPLSSKFSKRVVNAHLLHLLGFLSLLSIVILLDLSFCSDFSHYGHHQLNPSCQTQWTLFLICKNCFGCFNTSDDSVCLQSLDVLVSGTWPSFDGLWMPCTSFLVGFILIHLFLSCCS